MSRDPRHGIAAGPDAAKAALGPALEQAATTIATEVAIRLSAEGQDAAFTMGRAEDRVTLTVTLPGAVAREYGTRATPARPIFRPAVAAVRNPMAQGIATTLRHALQGRFR